MCSVVQTESNPSSSAASTAARMPSGLERLSKFGRITPRCTTRSYESACGCAESRGSRRSTPTAARTSCRSCSRSTATRSTRPSTRSRSARAAAADRERARAPRRDGARRPLRRGLAAAVVGPAARPRARARRWGGGGARSDCSPRSTSSTNASLRASRCSRSTSSSGAAGRPPSPVRCPPPARRLRLTRSSRPILIDSSWFPPRARARRARADGSRSRRCRAASADRRNRTEVELAVVAREVALGRELHVLLRRTEQLAQLPQVEPLGRGDDRPRSPRRSRRRASSRRRADRPRRVRLGERGLGVRVRRSS